MGVGLALESSVWNEGHLSGLVARSNPFYSIQNLCRLTISKLGAIEVILGGRVSKLQSAVYVVSVVFQNVLICRPKDLVFL